MQGQSDHNDLQLKQWQYQICHTSSNSFLDSNVVFLKSNPELPLVVMNVDVINNKVNVCVKNYFLDCKEIISFPPQCLLQYDYAGLKVSKSHSMGDICISLN